MEQINIFDVIFEAYKSKRPINVIELFAGYGSTTLALKYMGANFYHHKICEWAMNSIIAYASVHRNELEDYGMNFCDDLSKEQIAQLLCDMGVSLDYNKPATLEQLKRVSEDKLRLCFNSIMWSNNLVDITKVKGKDLAIEREREYWLFYSFPCQDLSLAGKGAGMGRNDNTRSGLLWQVERILNELTTLPKILIMENVIQVHGAGNDVYFKEWQLALERLGYQNYWQDLVATDYGIPQTRNRTFMISILGNYNYNFPKSVELKLRLKDLLETNVDEKYYLSDKMINYISANNEKWTGNNSESLINKEIASTINTGEGSRRCDASNYVSDELGENYNLKEKLSKHLTETLEQNSIPNGISAIDGYNRKIINDGTINTISTKCFASADRYIAIKNATKKGYLEITESVLIGGFGAKGSTNQYRTQNRVYSSSSSSPTLSTAFNPYFSSNLRIRKLTPRECFRLQGVKDADIDLIMENQTNSSGYHLAGDSICITVLMAIYSTILDKNWVDYFNPKEWWNIN